MSRTYIATIMDRHYMNDKAIAFSCNQALIGRYNEENDLFIDKDGNSFCRMCSAESLNGKETFSFANLMDIEELLNYFENNISLKEAIKQYEKLCSEVIHFVSIKDGEAIYTALNSNDLYKYEKKEEDSDEEVYSIGIQDLFEAVIDGKYNLDELNMMYEQLSSDYENIECVIEAIETQIEAYEDDLYDKAMDEIEQKEEKKEKKEKEELNIEVTLEEPKTIDIEDLFNKVTKTLIAQDEPTRRVITELARKELDDRKKREGLLLTGPTGVGKTELMRLIAKYLGRPFYKINSTQLTTPGYVGKDIEEALWDLYIQCGRDIKKTESAIIFFDEIDKKGSHKKDDPSGKGVLNVLLPFIEGSTYDACADMRTAHEKVKIDTSNMIVILGGAYTDVYKNLVEKNIPGFNGVISSKPRYRKATTKDFTDRGMMTDEFMGRVTVIKLNDLGVDDIKRVMLESDESAIKIQEEIFNKMGVKLTFTDGFASEVAKQADEKKTGARGLNGIIDEATWKAFGEVHSHRGEYEEVILDENTVNDSSNYQLVKKKKDNL